MRKFKKGDLVKGIEDKKISPLLGENMIEAEVLSVNEDKMSIKIIRHLSDAHAVGAVASFQHMDRFDFADCMQPNHNFVKGDHVKGTGGNDYLTANEKLIDAEVTEDASMGRMGIKCLRFIDGNTESAGKGLVVDSNYFDYADGFLSDYNRKKRLLSEPVFGTVSSFMINGSEYTNEQYIKDCERFVKACPHYRTIELQHAIEDVLIVYQWAQENPTNLEHYAAELGWNKERSDFVYFGVCPIPYTNYETCPKRISGGEFTCKKCREWWNQTWKGAECSTQ
jgi:hypothetical protein